MNLRLSKKEWLILIPSFLLAGLAFTAAYFLYLSPLKNDVQNADKQLIAERQILETVQEQAAEGLTGTVQETAGLQKTLPVKPLVEQFLLDLDKAETVSGSFITKVEVSDDGLQPENQLLPDSGLQTDLNPQSDNLNNSERTDSPNNDEAGSTEERLLQPMPEGVQKKTIKLSVEASGYYEVETFIETLEKLDRAVVVESIEFTAPEEVTSLVQEKEKIAFELSLSIFFMPGLTDLQDEIPKIDIPAPANKRSPVNGFAESKGKS